MLPHDLCGPTMNLVERRTTFTKCLCALRHPEPAQQDAIDVAPPLQNRTLNRSNECCDRGAVVPEVPFGIGQKRSATEVPVNSERVLNKKGSLS